MLGICKRTCKVAVSICVVWFTTVCSTVVSLELSVERVAAYPNHGADVTVTFTDTAGGASGVVGWASKGCDGEGDGGQTTQGQTMPTENARQRGSKAGAWGMLLLLLLSLRLGAQPRV